MRAIWLVLALGLAGCGSAAQVDIKPVTELGEALAAPPAAMTDPCANPVTIPNKALSAGEVAPLWGADRTALASCRDKHAAETQFYTSRDKGLAGK